MSDILIETVEQVKIANKNREYPTLDPQQLLSLIRANQILITYLEERVQKLERKCLE